MVSAFTRTAPIKVHRGRRWYCDPKGHLISVFVYSWISNRTKVIQVTTASSSCLHVQLKKQLTVIDLSNIKVLVIDILLNFLFYYSGFSLLFFECSSTSCVLQSVMYVYIVSVLAWPHVWSTNFSMHWFSSVLPHTSKDMSSCLVSYPYNHRLHLYCMLSIGWSNT